MSAAICLNLDLSKMLSSGNGLKHHHDVLYQANYQIVMDPLPMQSQWLMILKWKTLENIVGKGENAGNQHFGFFPQCFLNYLPAFQDPFSMFESLELLFLQIHSVWTCLNCVIWLGVRKK